MISMQIISFILTNPGAAVEISIRGGGDGVRLQAYVRVLHDVRPTPTLRREYYPGLGLLGENLDRGGRG